MNINKEIIKVYLPLWEKEKIFKKWQYPLYKLTHEINEKYKTNLSIEEVKWILKQEPIQSDLHAIIAEDRKEIKEKREERNVKDKYKELLIKMDDLESQVEALTEMKEHKPNKLEIKPTIIKSEATAVILAGDWHIDEVVDPTTVNNLNEYNPTIAEQRAKSFFKNSLRLTDIMAKDVKLENIVMALLWDFITWYIHPELVEWNSSSPTEAILKFQDIMTSWINYILDNSNYKLNLVCKFWNHWRTTDKSRISTGFKNSFEWMIYHILATQFKDNPRINFIIENWYNTYFKIYDYTLRFHHWDQINYWWWVWGITIPLNKAIWQWNKAKHTDLDCLWHWHQTISGKNFMINWSMIWYNAYWIKVKWDYEKPQQTFFLIDKNFWRTITAPIFLDI